MEKKIYELYHYKWEWWYYEYIVTEHKAPISKETEEYDEYWYRYKVWTEVQELSVKDFIHRFYPEIWDILEKFISNDSFNEVKKLIQERDYASNQNFILNKKIEEMERREVIYIRDIEILNKKCKDFTEQIEILKN